MPFTYRHANPERTEVRNEQTNRHLAWDPVKDTAVVDQSNPAYGEWIDAGSPAVLPFEAPPEPPPVARKKAKRRTRVVRSCGHALRATKRLGGSLSCDREAAARISELRELAIRRDQRQRDIYAALAEARGWLVHAHELERKEHTT
jgi:hypothetical protein